MFVSSPSHSPGVGTDVNTTAAIRPSVPTTTRVVP
jgi:hypothetical protein